MAPGCPKAAAARAALGLGPTSRVLVINTEGATDPVNFAKQLKLPDVPFEADDFSLAPPLPRSVLKAAPATSPWLPRVLIAAAVLTVLALAVRSR